jgi:CubicO group peptidase (beta-lactamase class C family)
MSSRSAYRRTCWSVSPLVLALALFFGSSYASLPTVEEKLDQYLNAADTVLQFNGTALVAKGGKVIFAKGYGMADREKKTPNTVDTKFLIGSITKQFTATAIMQLVADKKLDIDNPISTYLTDYPKSTGDKITIRHLLTHTSGIQNFTDLPAYQGMRDKSMTPQQVVAQFKDLPLDFEPGTKFNYSNSGYILLGLVIEKVSGEPYAQYLQKRIFDPIGMKNTGYMDYRTSLMAVGYEPDSTGHLKLSIKVDPMVPFSAGALYSTVGDMLLWDQALYGGKVLSQELLKQMWTPNLGMYGFGWVIDTLYGHKRIWHNGGIDGFVSGFQRFVDDSICIVLLSNNGGINEGMLSAGLAAITFHQPYAIPVIKKPIEIDPAVLADYVGAYQVAPDVYRFIKREGPDTLYAQRTGGPARLLLAESKDRFYYDYDNSITIDFVRDSTGKVISHQIFQGGQTSTATRLFGPAADSLLVPVETGRVDPASLDPLVGSYQLAPGFVLDIRRKGNELFAQATGQGELPIYPRSETEYFYKAVDAQLSFVKDSTGKISSLILHQAGRNLPGSRVK